MTMKSMRFPERFWKELEAEAKEKNISVSAYIRMILSERKR